MKILVADPVCVQEKGHNLAALARYTSFISQITQSPVISAANKLLPFFLNEAVPGNIDWIRIFHHYYIKSIPVPAPDNPHIEIAKLGGNELNLRLISLACRDFLDLADQVKLNRDFLVFYPSIDYYSIHAIISYLKGMDPQESPLFIIRWIGVMENAFYGNSESVADLCETLKSLSQKGHRISHTCEGSVYANKLAQYLQSVVSTTPTLVNETLLPYPRNDVFTIVFPGSGRIDKGFDRIANILTHLQQRYPSFNYKAIVQLLPTHELEHHYNLVRELGLLSRVVLQPSSISQDKLIKNIQISDLIVVPYHPKTYEFRSSAIMAEAVCFGRSVIASENCGFSDELRYYGIGVTAQTDEEFADAIFAYAQSDIKTREQTVKQAYFRFYQYSKQAYESLFLEVIK